MLMRSCTPGTPWGILVKSSLPIAFCLVVKGRWSDVTTFRVSLHHSKKDFLCDCMNIWLNETTQIVNQLTFLEGWAGNWVCWGQVWAVAQWRKQPRGPSPGGSTASHLRQREQWWSLHAPLSLPTIQYWESPYAIHLWRFRCHIEVQIKVYK